MGKVYVSPGVYTKEVDVSPKYKDVYWVSVATANVNVNKINMNGTPEDIKKELDEIENFKNFAFWEYPSTILVNDITEKVELRKKLRNFTEE